MSVSDSDRELVQNAANGHIIEWKVLQPILLRMISEIEDSSLREIILERLQAIESTPITWQRLCELVYDPGKNYNCVSKWMRAVYKVLQVNLELDDSMDLDLE